MPKKKAKLVELKQKIDVARRIVAKQQAIVDKLLATRKPSVAAEGILRTYQSSLNHLEAHRLEMRQDAKARKGESRKYSR
jgi:hypothetical protein